jgi:hypothetical protein
MLLEKTNFFISGKSNSRDPREFKNVLQKKFGYRILSWVNTSFYCSLEPKPVGIVPNTYQAISFLPDERGNTISQWFSKGRLWGPFTGFCRPITNIDSFVTGLQILRDSLLTVYSPFIYLISSSYQPRLFKVFLDMNKLAVKKGQCTWRIHLHSCQYHRPRARLISVKKIRKTTAYLFFSLMWSECQFQKLG